MDANLGMAWEKFASIARSLDGEPPHVKHPVEVSRGDCVLIVKALQLLVAVREAQKWRSDR